MIYIYNTHVMQNFPMNFLQDSTPAEEFPVLGGSGDTVPEVRPRCDPGLGAPWRLVKAATMEKWWVFTGKIWKNGEFYRENMETW